MVVIVTIVSKLGEKSPYLGEEFQPTGPGVNYSYNPTYYITSYDHFHGPPSKHYPPAKMMGCKTSLSYLAP